MNYVNEFTSTLQTLSLADIQNAAWDVAKKTRFAFDAGSYTIAAVSAESFAKLSKKLAEAPETTRELAQHAWEQTDWKGITALALISALALYVAKSILCSGAPTAPAEDFKAKCNAEVLKTKQETKKLEEANQKVEELRKLIDGNQTSADSQQESLKNELAGVRQEKDSLQLKLTELSEIIELKEMEIGQLKHEKSQLDETCGFQKNSLELAQEALKETNILYEETQIALKNTEKQIEELINAGNSHKSVEINNLIKSSKPEENNHAQLSPPVDFTQNRSVFEKAEKEKKLREKQEKELQLKKQALEDKQRVQKEKEAETQKKLESQQNQINQERQKFEQAVLFSPVKPSYLSIVKRKIDESDNNSSSSSSSNAPVNQVETPLVIKHNPKKGAHIKALNPGGFIPTTTTTTKEDKNNNNSSDSSVSTKATNDTTVSKKQQKQLDKQQKELEKQKLEEQKK